MKNLTILFYGLSACLSISTVVANEAKNEINYIPNAVKPIEIQASKSLLRINANHLDYSSVTRVCLTNKDYNSFNLGWFVQKGISTQYIYWKIDPGTTACLGEVRQDGSIILQYGGETYYPSELVVAYYGCSEEGCYYTRPGDRFYTKNQQISLTNMLYSRFSGDYRVFDDADPAGFNQYQNIDFPAGFGGYKNCAHMDSAYNMVSSGKYEADIVIRNCSAH